MIRTVEVIRYVLIMSMSKVWFKTLYCSWDVVCKLLQCGRVHAAPGFRTGCGPKFDNILALCGVEPISGVYCVVDPPVPIPNTVVKRFCGDNTGGTSLWEDSTAPDY